MSSDLKAKLKPYFAGLLSHPVCFSNAVLLALTTGFEQAWETVLLKCPERSPDVGFWISNQLYASVFLFAPALALWLLGILGSHAASRLCQGWNHRGDKEKVPCCCLSCVIALRTVVVPLTWIFVALMDGDLYACYHYMPNCPEHPTGSGLILVMDVNCTQNSTAWNYENKGESQLWGWLVLVICLVLASCIVCCGRCMSKRTYFPHLYSTELKKEERKQLEKGLLKKAENDGKRLVGALMMTLKPEEEQLSTSEWEAICTEYKEQECKPASQGAVKGTEVQGAVKGTEVQGAVKGAEVPNAGKGPAVQGAGNQGNGNQDASTQTENKEQVLYHSNLDKLMREHRSALLVKYDEEIKAQEQKNQNVANPQTNPSANPPNP